MNGDEEVRNNEEMIGVADCVCRVPTTMEGSENSRRNNRCAAWPQ